MKSIDLLRRLSLNPSYQLTTQEKSRLDNEDGVVQDFNIVTQEVTSNEIVAERPKRKRKNKK